jgi:hypothetical protein
MVVLSLASAGDKQVQLSLIPAGTGIQFGLKNHARYYLQRRSAQESETESLGTTSLDAQWRARIFLSTNMMTTYI